MSAIAPVSPARTEAASLMLHGPGPSTQTPEPGGDFAALIADGIKAMDAKVEAADNLVKAFALDDTIPVHQVTFALEEARLSVELTMQIRSRLLEGYREIMGMQL